MTENRPEGMAIGFITDEALADLRSRIGIDLRRVRYNTQATVDTIRHFCHGIGDENPLYCDESYAARTRYCGVIAPPTFLYSVFWAGSGGMGLPGVHGFAAGSDWDIHRIIHVGDTISFKQRLVDVVEKPSRFGRRTVIMYGEGFYRNQCDQLIARCLGWSVRAERRAAREQGKYKGIEKARYTAEQLRDIEDDYFKEAIRGANPRYWEDVTIGDSLGHVVKGPLNMTDMFGFVSGTFGAGALGRGGAHGIAVRYRRRHPMWAYTDPKTGVTDIPEMVHADDAMAEEIGVPGAYDYGCQRISWLGHLLTNWQGDDGFVKKLYGELRRFNVLGDTTWCRGKVTRKYVEDSEHLVECDIYCENQRGEVTAPGRATVVLPSRTVTPIGHCQERALSSK